MLPDLEHLQIIELHFKNADQISLDVLDREFGMLAVWGSLCPSIEVFIFPSKFTLSPPKASLDRVISPGTVIWGRLKDLDSFWVPLGDATECTLWWVQQIESEKYPELRKLVADSSHKLGEGGILNTWNSLLCIWCSELFPSEFSMMRVEN
jgi:hypothetical protein